ncbi:hypothetical protein P3T23_006747, partial [Paraburkholderia sp. GAS448]
YVVNRFFNRPSLPTTSQSLANPGFPLPRAFFRKRERPEF